MTPSTTDIADLPARLGQLIETPRAAPAPVPTIRTRWEDREPTLATYPPEVAALVERLQREEQHKPVPPSSSSSQPTPVTTTPTDAAAASVIKNEDTKPSPPEGAAQFELPLEGIMNLALTRISAESGIQTRVKMDDVTVEEYAEAMRAGSTFPALIVFAEGSQYRLLDGFHRLEAARRAGLKTLKVEVKHGDRLESTRYALQANVRHGLRRTNADKRHSVRIALREFATLSDRSIAGLCGVGNALVSEMRQVCDSNNSQPRIGRDGKSYTVRKAAGIAAGCRDRVASREPTTDTSTAVSDAVAHELAAPTPHRPCLTDVGMVGRATLRDFNATLPGTAVDRTNPTDRAGTLSSVERTLIPADQLAQTIVDVSASGIDANWKSVSAEHTRRMIPLVAELLERYAREFPSLAGCDLCLVLGMANEKIASVMKWQ